MAWVEICKLDAIEREDVVRFDMGKQTYAIIRSPDDEVYCTAGLCTHEAVHLADGLVMDHEIECPKHNATFDYRTGEALRPPACSALKTYATKVDDGVVFVDIT